MLAQSTAATAAPSVDAAAGVASRLDGTRWRYVLTALGVAFSGFHLYTAAFGVLLAHQQRLVHLALAMVMGFLSVPVRRGAAFRPGLPWPDLMLAVATAAIAIYVFADFQAFAYRRGDLLPSDVWVGAGFTLLVLELTRRAVGWPLALIASGFLAFALLGHLLPGGLGHRSISLRRLVDHMFMGTDGILGVPVGVSATYITIFVIFGAFLEVSRQGQFFIHLALGLVGRAVGGAAKAAVVASALIGCISGSSIANVVISGTFTIPLMIRNGYSRVFAGAVEAAASTGGQIMPPVMGSAAFLMVEYTGIAYSNIMLAAAIPAVLYFVGVYLAVHFQARKARLLALPSDQVPSIARLLRQQWYQLIPPTVLVWLLVEGYTTMWAGLVAIGIAILVTCVNWRERLRGRDIVHALELSARNMLAVAIACAAAGIIAGSISVTGIGLKLAGLVETLADGRLWVALVITMFACLVLGMGLPTVATYVVLVTIAAPALQKMGVSPLAAHLFVFYFGVVADVTPPVALAAFSAAAISGGNAFRTGVVATILAAAGFLVPFAFIYAPEMLLIGATAQWGWWGMLVLTVAVKLLGLAMLSAALIGHLAERLGALARWLLGLGGLLTVSPIDSFDTFAIALFALVLGQQLWARRRRNASALPGSTR